MNTLCSFDITPIYLYNVCIHRCFMFDPNICLNILYWNPHGNELEVIQHTYGVKRENSSVLYSKYTFYNTLVYKCTILNMYL